MNYAHDFIKNPRSNLPKNVNDLGISNKYSDKLGKLLYQIFSDIDYLTVVLNMEIPFLTSIADKLPEKKPAFVVTVETLIERIERVNRNNEKNKMEVKKISDEIKLLLEAYQNNGMDVEVFKNSVREAMKLDDWLAYKRLWCDHLVMRDFVNEVAAENALELCNYLVNQIDVVKNNLNLMKDIINQLEDNISIIIKLRLQQIEANWSEITENVTLFKQQPKYWEGCG